MALLARSTASKRAEVAGRADRIEAMLDGRAIVLCDVDHGAALELGLAFHAGADLVQRYLKAGLDLADIYGTDAGILPVPATRPTGSESRPAAP